MGDPWEQTYEDKLKKQVWLIFYYFLYLRHKISIMVKIMINKKNF